LAIKIAEKFSTKERNLLRMEKLVKDGLERNKQTGALLSIEDLDYLKPYESKLRLSVAKQELLKNSHKKAQELVLKEKREQEEKLRRQKRFNRVVTFAAVVALGLAVFVCIMWLKAEEAINKSDIMQIKVETAIFDKAIKERNKEWKGYNRYD
jgi:hypothetical protein